MISFWLDNRERAIIDLLNKHKNTNKIGYANICKYVQVGQLDVGDFQVQNETGEIILIIERKTIPDLISSIKDGRYHEQKQRMKCVCTKVVYLIEGQITFDDNLESSGAAKGKFISNTPNKTIVSCLINSSLRDNIFIFNTKCLEETVSFLACIVDRYINNPNKYYLVDSNSNANAVYTDSNESNEYTPSTGTVRSKKRDNIDSKQCLILQLCAIPGISVSKARAIIAHVDAENMKEFICKIGNLENGEDVLKACPGIGKVLSKNMRAFLIGSTSTSEYK